MEKLQTIMLSMVFLFLLVVPAHAYTRFVPDSTIISTNVGNPFSGAPADIDGDGDMDIVSGGNQNDLLIWFENSSGDASTWVEHSIGTADSFREVCAYDLDQDGDMDVLSASWEDSKLSWWENTNGDGSTWSEHQYGTSSSAHTIFPVDIDGDGDPDIITGAYGDYYVYWWENSSGDASSWIKHTVSGFVNWPAFVRAADFDNDGDFDIAASISSHAGKLLWFENSSGDGSTWTEHIVSNTLSAPGELSLADIDGDGDADIAVSVVNDNKIAWYENSSGDGLTWTEHVISTLITQPVGSHVADIDNDGDVDLFTSSGPDNTVLMHLNSSGDGSTWETSILTSTLQYAWGIDTADFNSDGDLDIVTTAYGDDSIRLFENEPTDINPLDIGLIAYYPFNGNANDESGNGNDGVEFDLSYVQGINGEATSFNGESSRVIVADSSSLDLEDELTLSVWIKQNDQDRAPFILTKGGGSRCNYEFRTGFDGDIFGFGKQNVWTRWKSQTKTGVWSHLAVAYDSGSSSITAYLNGKEISTSLRVHNFGFNLTTNNLPLYIGHIYKAYDDTYAHFFNGLMDDLRIYNRVLSEAEIHELYGGNPDLDNDGISDDEDNCPNIANPDQGDADGDGSGDVCDVCPNDENNDADGDGVCGNVDNCPTVANSGQEDFDGNGIGDVCDEDLDGDGVINQWDTCPGTPADSCVNVNGCQALGYYSQAEYDEKVAEIEDLNLTITANIQTIADLNAIIVAMFTQEELNQAVEDAEAAKDLIINDLSAQLATANIEINALQNENAQLKVQLTEAEANIIDLTSQVTNLNDQITERDQTISTQATLIDSLVAALLKKHNADASAAGAVGALAQNAIDDAIAADGKAKEIEKAQREMEKAQREMDHEKYDKAIDHYKKAWEHAQRALKNDGPPGPKHDKPKPHKKH